MNEERLRELYVAAQARRAAQGEPCGMPFETMMDVLEGRGSEEDRRQALAAIMRNPACREEFELLRSASRASRGIPRPGTPTGGRRRLAGIVALVGLSLAAAMWLGRREQQGRIAGELVPLVGPAEGADVTPPAPFSWRPVPGAVDYTLQIVRQGGESVLAVTLRDTSYTWAVEAAQVAGQRFFWLVSASLSSGKSVHSSARAFRVPTP
jgi:hypothetical protein